MNSIGKIFVGLIATMSLILLSLFLVIYASHKNWKEVAAKKDDQIKAAKEETAKLTTMKQDLMKAIDTEYIAYQKQVAALKTKTDNLKIENEKLSSQEQMLQDEINKRTEIINDTNIVIDRFRDNVKMLTQSIAEAKEKRSDILEKLAIAVGQLHENATVLGDIQAKNNKLKADYNKAVSVLTIYGIDPQKELYTEKVQGVVEAIQEGSNGLVMISIGADNGLTPGQKLEVSRDNTYLGKIEVVTTKYNSAVCQILPQYRQGLIQEGDNVSTKF
ncbi:MAG: hypothetical protein Q4C95_01525 [Planctomycetia bacterium]|nr:hypothetical protein [Planctomycetia bacterium]